MRLGFVREVFVKYEGWGLSKFIYGTSPEIKRIQNFIQKFSQLSDDYDSTLSDIYELCQLLPLKSDKYDIIVIKNGLYPIQENKNFLKTFQSLKNASLVNVINFPLVFDTYNNKILSELFCNSLEENIVCDKEVFDEIPRMLKPRIQKILENIQHLDKPFLTNVANDILYRANKNTEDCYLRSM